MSGPFRERLNGIQSRVEGSLGLSLLGLDGIAIDSIRVSEAIPLDSLGAELGSFIKSIRLNNTEMDVGEVEQFSLVTDRYVTLLSSVTEEYFLLLVLARDGNFGRARYELMKAKYMLRDELI